MLKKSLSTLYTFLQKFYLTPIILIQILQHSIKIKKKQHHLKRNFKKKNYLNTLRKEFFFNYSDTKLSMTIPLKKCTDQRFLIYGRIIASLRRNKLDFVI